MKGRTGEGGGARLHRAKREMKPEKKTKGWEIKKRNRARWKRINVDGIECVSPPR